MYKKFFCNFYILANRILFKQIVHFVRILVADPILYYIYFIINLYSILLDYNDINYHLIVCRILLRNSEKVNDA